MPPRPLAIRSRPALFVLLASGALFALIAAQVALQGGLTLWDLRLSARFEHLPHAAWLQPTLALTNAHATVPLLIWAGLFGLYLLGQRAWYWLLALGLAVPGGMLLNVGLKESFQRARPQFAEPLVNLATYSFPSGHALGATVLYGMLAVYLARHLARRGARLAACLACVLMIALVSLSRVMLGAHYPSDVTAGILEGIGWLALCLAAVSSLERRRAH